jgi:nitrous oxide reductase accessory protein NosL
MRISNSVCALNLQSMKSYIKLVLSTLLMTAFVMSCSNDDDNNNMPETIDFSGTFAQQDQMGRPSVNTVFVSSSSKNMFNTTIPSEQKASFQCMFQAKLEGLSPAYANPGDANALSLDSATFTGLLATDVLNVSLDGTTTFLT